MKEYFKLLDEAAQVEIEVKLLLQGESAANCVELLDFVNGEVVAGQELVAQSGFAIEKGLVEAVLIVH